MTWKNGTLLALCVVLAGAMLLTNRESVQGQQGEKKGPPRYTVIETQGHNLLVTDNGTNKLYYYSTDKDAKIGSDLKLRGSIDLTQVGSDVVKINTVSLAK